MSLNLMRLKPSDLIADESKWYRGVGVGCNGKECLWSAVETSFGHCNSQDYRDALIRIKQHLGLPIGGNNQCLFDWNDDPARTHAEVVAALKACGL